jgi:hypothetical protein
LVLNQTSVEFLVGCGAKGRETLIKALEELAANPHQSGEWVAKDSTGRPVQIKHAHGFLITFWPDSFVKELRVIKIERGASQIFR